jgi:ABC-2 type transport system ATP-binding protein
MSEPALWFDDVTRCFGRRVALDRLNLAVEPGTVLGLVGRNGAGKTTLLRLAHGILYPDRGRIRVLGLDPVEEGIELRARVSLLSEEAALYPWMRVEEIVEFAAALHPRWDRALAGSLSTRLELDPRQRIRTLSRGSRAKVALVLAVACRPELLLLDDPTAGLDPLVRREILEGILEAVSEEGGAVVYASHLVHDIERVADRVAFLDEGKLRLEGTLDGLKDRIRRARAVFDDGAPADADLPGKIDCRVDGRLLAVVAQADNGELVGALQRLGARDVEIEILSLEEILVACLREGGRSEVRSA